MTTTYIDNHGHEHRFESHDHSVNSEPIECVYCNAIVPGCDDCPIPPVGADEEWARLSDMHYAGCEWTETRAHQLPRIN